MCFRSVLWQQVSIALIVEDLELAHEESRMKYRLGFCLPALAGLGGFLPPFGRG